MVPGSNHLQVPGQAVEFQSLSRDGVVPGILLVSPVEPPFSFNPSVGMGWFQAVLSPRAEDVVNSFNPSVGMGWFQAMWLLPPATWAGVSIPQWGWGGSRLEHINKMLAKETFQSLSRDGVVPGENILPYELLTQAGFNPSVGMGWFQAD